MIDYDKYGYCINCHKNMYVYKVVSIDGAKKEIQVLSPKYREVHFVLNNNSIMKVACCVDCEEIIQDESKYDEIMKKVFKGWEVETRELVDDENKPQWTEEKRAEYLAQYSMLKIVAREKGLNKQDKEKKIKEFKDKEKN